MLPRVLLVFGLARQQFISAPAAAAAAGAAAAALAAANLAAALPS